MNKLAVITRDEGIRSVPVRDNSPREMFISSFLAFEYPGNVWKRADLIDKLAHSIGAKVFYGMNSTSCGVETADGLYYEAGGLRDTEAALRWLKRKLETTADDTSTLSNP